MTWKFWSHSSQFIAIMDRNKKKADSSRQVDLVQPCKRSVRTETWQWQNTARVLVLHLALLHISAVPDLFCHYIHKIGYIKAKNMGYRHSVPVTKDKQVTAWNRVWIIADVYSNTWYTKQHNLLMAWHTCRHIATLMSPATDLQHKLENILVQLLLQCFSHFAHISKSMSHLVILEYHWELFTIKPLVAEWLAAGFLGFKGWGCFCNKYLFWKIITPCLSFMKILKQTVMVLAF